MNEQDWRELNFYTKQQSKYFLLKNENKKISARLNELEEINVGRSKYFSMISHDLRAPFHGIMGCADILLHESDTLDEESGHRLLQYIYDTSNSTYTLLESLLNWSMARGGHFHLNQNHFRVDDVVQDVLDLLFASAYKKQISLHSNVEIGLFAYADIHMVTSILQNLISNALKFTPGEDQRKITLSAHTVDDKVEIIIQDNGIGMTLSQLDRLFQGNTTPSTQGTSGEKGMGLGLALCKQFLALNHGSMTVTSVIDEGTCFTLYLPLGDKNA